MRGIEAREDVQEEKEKMSSTGRLTEFCCTRVLKDRVYFLGRAVARINKHVSDHK